jgi:ribonuclease-3 family protein
MIDRAQMSTDGFFQFQSIKASSAPRTKSGADQIPLRMLANLGDAVCTLYEKEKAISDCASAAQMHRRVQNRVNAKCQASFLENLSPLLQDTEIELVRRARNLKMSNFNKHDQATYRHSTAFEALVGFLYLENVVRLTELFKALEDCSLPGSRSTNP